MRIAIIPKQSAIEWNMHRLSKGRNELLEWYANQERDVEKMVRSEARQHESIERIIDMFPGADVYAFEEFNKEKAKQYDLAVVIGGDNMLQMVAHHIEDTPIMGINSDRITSTGALLRFNPNNAQKYVRNILQGKFGYEDWTRAEADINGKPVEDARGCFSLSNMEDDMMTRYKLKFREQEEVQEGSHKGSGVIVTTGAGSSGWYRDAGIYLPQVRSGFCSEPAVPFSPDKRILKTLTREPYGGVDCTYKMLNLEIKRGEELELIYWSPDNAKLSSDSVIRYVVSEGDRIKFRVSPRTFRVVTPEKIYD